MNLCDLFSFFRKDKGKVVTLFRNGNKITGLFFQSRVSSKSGIIYCHGGFGQTGGFEDYIDAATYAKSGYHVFVIKYELEGSDKISLVKDVKEAFDGAVALCDRLNLHKVFCLGTSRGGFVALHTMVAHYEFFAGGIIHVAPTHIPSWKVETSIIKPTLNKILPYFIWSGDEAMSSPCYYALNLAQKPIILHYGEQDKVVPMSQGTRLVQLIGNPDKCKYLLWNYGHGLAVKKDVILSNIKWLRSV